MIKRIDQNIIYFYNDKEEEIMHIDFSKDDCIWYFNSSNVFKITQDMILYQLLEEFMSNEYTFSDDILPDYKDTKRLIWYSDCYYDPDDEWSVASVSCLNIERKENYFNVWCTKKLDDIIDRPNKTFGICFSPCGNGKYSRNVNTGNTLQDDFVMYVYHGLLENSKIKRLKR